MFLFIFFDSCYGVFLMDIVSISYDEIYRLNYEDSLEKKKSYKNGKMARWQSVDYMCWLDSKAYGTTLQEERAKARKQERYDRTRRRIKDLVYNNNMRYYCTITLNSDYKDRFDLKRVSGSLNKILKRNNIFYALVPEQHENGAWHFHGFLNLNPNYLVSKNKKDKYGNDVFTLDILEKNYGFSEIVDFGKPNRKNPNFIKAIKYTCSYVTKNSSKVRLMRSRVLPTDLWAEEKIMCDDVSYSEYVGFDPITFVKELLGSDKVKIVEV